MGHLDRHNVLVDHQHRFRARRSCETQLLSVMNDLSCALNNRQQVDMGVLDFSKAFEKVLHERLLQKIEHYGIRGNELGWIKAFLNNRSQAVVVDGAMSQSSPVTSGVPQGSVVGPVLFLLYINDIGLNTTSSLKLFADDCLLYRVIKSQDDVRMFQQELDRLNYWATKWQMAFNVSKCHVMRITNARKYVIGGDYLMGSESLQWTDAENYLGITFNNKLSWF